MRNDKLLTAKEATKVFRDAGLSETTFRKRVKDLKIEKYLPEGRQRGALYPENQVLAAISETVKEKKPARRSHTLLKTTTFAKATTYDMPEMATLLETFYRAKISIQKRAAWIERNPDIAYILRCENELVGCAFIMPLSEEKIFEILANQIKPPTRPHEIPLYEPGKHYNLYLRAVGILQSVSKVQRRHWAARFIIGLTRTIVDLGSKGIFIEKVYAQGDTKRGERALRMLGFMQIETHSPTSRKNYMLDVSKSGSVFAMRYKQALNIWRAQNEEE